MERAHDHGLMFRGQRVEERLLLVVRYETNRRRRLFSLKSFTRLTGSSAVPSAKSTFSSSGRDRRRR
jgi:hypothetical protein